MDMKSVARRSGHFIKQNAPTILTIAATVGTVTTAVFAAHDTLKAQAVIAEAEEESGEKLDMPDRIKKIAPCYIDTALMAGATVACIIGAHQTSVAKTGAYAAAYTMAQEAARNYRNEVIRVVGDKRSEEIDKKADQQVIANASNQMVFVGEGKVKCLDKISGRYFASTPTKLQQIENEINHQLLSDMWFSLNDYYFMLGLEPIKVGEELGWTADKLLHLKLRAGLDDNQCPILVVDYDQQPIADFYRKY